MTRRNKQKKKKRGVFFQAFYYFPKIKKIRAKSARIKHYYLGRTSPISPPGPPLEILAFVVDGQLAFETLPECEGDTNPIRR